MCYTVQDVSEAESACTIEEAHSIKIKYILVRARVTEE